MKESDRSKIIFYRFSVATEKMNQVEEILDLTNVQDPSHKFTILPSQDIPLHEDQMTVVGLCTGSSLDKVYDMFKESDINTNCDNCPPQKPVA